MGLTINDILLLRNANLFVKKSGYVLLTFDNSPIYIKETIRSISIIVKDLIGNHYTIELGFDKNKNDIVIKGIKTITDFSFDFIN